MVTLVAATTSNEWSPRVRGAEWGAGEVFWVTSKDLVRKEVVAGGDGVQAFDPLGLAVCLGETDNPVTKLEDGGLSEQAVRDGDGAWGQDRGHGCTKDGQVCATSERC